MTNRTGIDHAKMPLGTDPKMIQQQMTPLTHDAVLTALTLWSFMTTAVLLIAWKQRQVISNKSENQSKTRTINPMKPERLNREHMMGTSYKGPQGGMNWSLFQPTDTLSTPLPPNNFPITSPCLLPTLI